MLYLLCFSNFEQPKELCGIRCVLRCGAFSSELPLLPQTDALPFVRLRRHCILWSLVQKQSSGTGDFFSALWLLSALVFPGTWVVDVSELKKRLLGAEAQLPACCLWESCRCLGGNGMPDDPAVFILYWSLYSRNYLRLTELYPDMKELFFCWNSGLFLFTVS